MNYPKPETLAATAGRNSPVYIAVPQYKKQKIDTNGSYSLIDGAFPEFSQLSPATKMAIGIGVGLVAGIFLNKLLKRR